MQVRFVSRHEAFLCLINRHEKLHALLAKGVFMDKLWQTAPRQFLLAGERPNPMANASHRK
jgi:hypothetical protein